MARSKKHSAYGYVKIRKFGSNNLPLWLTFIDRDAYDETMRQLYKLEAKTLVEIVDAWFGGRTFDNAGDAMEEIEFMLS